MRRIISGSARLAIPTLSSSSYRAALEKDAHLCTFCVLPRYNHWVRHHDCRNIDWYFRSRMDRHGLCLGSKVLLAWADTDLACERKSLQSSRAFENPCWKFYWGEKKTETSANTSSWTIYVKRNLARKRRLGNLYFTWMEWEGWCWVSQKARQTCRIWKSKDTGRNKP